MQLSITALAAFEQHVLAEYPKEACGVVVAGEFIPCKNVAKEPTRDFAIKGTQIATIEVKHGNIEAVLHSHPYSGGVTHPPEWPSGHDMESWLKQSKPWGIVATDGKGITRPIWLDDGNPEPLEGREFIHGINDCYSVIRDWFRLERSIVLPNYARHMEWWFAGQDLYTENFAKAGFVEIKPQEVKVGDACLFQIRSPVVNHAAVITAPNQILHHMNHRLSGFDQLSKWERVITKYLRFQGQQ